MSSWLPLQFDMHTLDCPKLEVSVMPNISSALNCSLRDSSKEQSGHGDAASCTMLQTSVRQSQPAHQIRHPGAEVASPAGSAGRMPRTYQGASWQGPC